MDKNKLILESIPNQARANELLSRLFNVASPGAVFGEPVVHGEYALITASEVTIAMGAGYGGGGGTSPTVEDATTSEGDASAEDTVGSGGGGGGGGTATGRPVAIISIGPSGVHVEPILDPTKLGLALLTAIGGVFIAAARMRKLSRGSRKHSG